MTSQLMLLSPGPLASIQDLGRFGYRRFGVPQSGVLHPDLARIANTLAENSEDTAVIEFFLTGPSFRLEKGTVRLAFSGDFTIELTRGRAKRTLRSWRTLTLRSGDTLEVGPVKSGKVGYVSVAGGFDLLPVMGSCSTYLRGGFGGVNGNRLLPNTILAIAEKDLEDKPDRLLPRSPRPEFFGLTTASEAGLPTTIRVIMGPQEDYFTDAARKDFLTGIYTVSRESDRMGSRLEGPILAHHPDKKPEIISDGIVPGAIQVPGNGAPIVLLADGPTVGGYPKIATVTSADLAKLSVMLPGSRIRFSEVTPEKAEALLREQRTELDDLLASIVSLKIEKGVDMQAMYKTSLVSGVINAFELPI